jgi:hypothetical protein
MWSTRPTFALANGSAVPFSSSRKLKLPESNRDGIALGKRTKAAPVSRVGHLREHLPAFAQHLPDMSIHPFHAEEPLPMVGPVPASLVCERLDLHLNPVPSTCLETGPPVSVYAATSTVVPSAQRIFDDWPSDKSRPRSLRGHSFLPFPSDMDTSSRMQGKPPPYGGVIPERMSVLACWMCWSD